MNFCSQLHDAHDTASEWVLHKIERFMGAVGKASVRRPMATMSVSLLLAVFLSAGFAFLESETDAENLFAPEATRAFEENDLWEDTFGSRQRNAHRCDTYVYSPSQNVFTEDMMTRYETFYNAVLDMQTEYEGKTYQFAVNMCYNDTATTACEVSGAFSSIGLDSQNWPGQIPDQYLQSDPQTYSVYPTLTSFSRPQHDANGYLTEASAVKLTLQTVTFPDTDPNYDTQESASEEYWNDFLDLCDDMKDQMETGDIKFTYYTDTSIDNENSKAIGGDIMLFVIAINIICALAIVFNYRKKWVENKMWVAAPGLFSTMLAIPCAFGTLGWVGIATNPVVAVSPFLLLGIGVDDMFVLVRAFDLTSKDASVETRIVNTMKGAGVGIFFTSVTDFVAFMIGYASPYPAIQAFCIFCGFGVLYDFIFQCTIFMSFMVFQAERERDGKFTSFPWCCCRCKPDDDNHNAAEVDDSSSTPKEQRIERMKSFQLSGDINSHFDPEEKNNMFTKYVETLLLPHVSALVAIIFCVWIGLAAYGVSIVPVGQRVQDLAPEGSYLIDYLDANEEYFDEIGAFINVVLPDNLNYWDPDVQTKIATMMTTLQSDECGTEGSGLSWLADFTVYATANTIDITTEATFTNALIAYTNDVSTGGRYKNDILFDGVEQDSIFATRYQFNLRSPKSDEIVMEAVAFCLQPVRDILKDAQLGDPFMYEGSAIYAESVLIILKETLLTLSFAAISAWAICLILIPSLKLSAIVMCMVVSILLGVMGYLSFWGYRIDTVISVNLVMTIGFAVDNAAHIAHGYYHSVATTRPKKVADALNMVGIPILMGDLTTVLALFPLLFSSSFIFKSFFACIFLVMTFGAASAILFMPVLLAYIGPLPDHGGGGGEALDNMKTNSEKQLEMAGDDSIL